MIKEINEQQELKRQKGIPQIIFTVLSFICFLIIYKSMIINAIEPHYIEGLIFLIPTIVFSILTFCVRNNIIKRLVANILIFLIAIISGFFTIIIIMFFAFNSATDSITDVNKYEKVLRVISYSDHFPENISQDAKKIKLYYTPQFLQGSEQCFVKFNIDSNYINSEIESVSKNCEWHGYVSNDINEKAEQEHYGLFSSPFSHVGYENLKYKEFNYNDSEESIKDETNLEVFVIDSKPYKENDWNHGYTYGIAVDRQENSIIYFEKKW